MEKMKKSLTFNALLSSLRMLATSIFPLITYPYITRILSVENIGKINFGQSIVNYFMLLAGFGISSFAIRNGSQIREDNEQLNEFSNRIFTINVITTVISCIILIFVMILPTKVATYRTIILIQGLTVAMSPIAMDWLYTIEEDFGYITVRSIVIQLLSMALMFVFVKEENDVYLYVALTSMSTSLSNIFNFLHSKKYIKIKLVSDTHWNEYKSSILLFFVNSIATIIYLNADTTILGILKDDYAVGLYSVAVKIYTMVKQAFNAVVATTIPRLAYLRKNDTKEFENLTKKILSIATVCVIPAAIGMIILRKEAISLISGNNYMEAAPTLAILSVAIFFGILANILANGVLICMGREKCVVKATVVSAVENATLNFVFVPFLSQNGAAITTLLAEMTVLGMSLYYSRDVVIHMIDFSEFRNAIFGSVLMLLVSFPVSKVLANNHLFTKIVIMIAICAGVYAIVLILLRDKVLFSILGQAKGKLAKQKCPASHHLENK